MTSIKSISFLFLSMATKYNSSRQAFFLHRFKNTSPVGPKHLQLMDMTVAMEDEDAIP